MQYLTKETSTTFCFVLGQLNHISQVVFVIIFYPVRLFGFCWIEQINVYGAVTRGHFFLQLAAHYGVARQVADKIACVLNTPLRNVSRNETFRCDSQEKNTRFLLFITLLDTLHRVTMYPATCLAMLSSSFALQVAGKIALCNSAFTVTKVE